MAQAEPKSVAPGVAILIDFENLVFGLKRNQPGRLDEDMDELDLDLLLGFAAEYGPVALMRAYGDWRSRELNQYQVDLDRSGIDIVNVFSGFGAQIRKNSADVRMAVDATECIWTLPHVHTYMIVSGDRDFIHVLKTLRRYGKRVIGVAAEKAASADFAKLCDRFMTYRNLVKTYGDDAGAAALVADPARMQEVREALVRILEANPEGILGSALKQAVRRVLPTFDETDFGYRSFRLLLEALPGVVQVVAPTGQGDIRVYAAGTGVAGGVRASAWLADSPQRLLLRRVALTQYRFIEDAAARRALFEALYRNMAKPEGFRWREVTDEILAGNNGGSALSTTVLAKVWSMLYQGRAFDLRDADQDLPLRERTVHLVQGIRSAGDLLDLYERSALYKAAEVLRGEFDEEAAALCLGVDLEAPGMRERIQAQMEAVRAMQARPPADAPEPEAHGHERNS